MSTPLRVVTTRSASEAASLPGSISQRVRQLQEEAQRLAREHIDALSASLARTREIADEIAQGGEAYPPGVRDLARRLVEETSAKAMTIEAIVARR